MTKEQSKIIREMDNDTLLSYYIMYHDKCPSIFEATDGEYARRVCEIFEAIGTEIKSRMSGNR